MGAFWQRQEHNIEQNYLIDDLASSLSVTGRSDTIWLTKQDRVDQDYAVFGEVYFDITDKLTGTLGMRVYKTENSLEGYFGFGAGYSSSGNSGEALCENQNGGVPVADLPDFQGAPCKNLDASTDDSDAIYKGNLAYKITENALVYATYSEGFRPGGLNRRGSVPPYKPDFLTNYELGWKTSWVDDRLRFNGAVFHEIWENFQYSVLGANGLTEITNSAEAEIDGLEMDLNWVLAEGWGISAGVAFIDAKLTQPYCANLLNGEVVTSDPCLLADGSTTPPLLQRAPSYPSLQTSKPTSPVGTNLGLGRCGPMCRGRWFMWARGNPTSVLRSARLSVPCPHSLWSTLLWGLAGTTGMRNFSSLMLSMSTLNTVGMRNVSKASAVPSPIPWWPRPELLGSASVRGSSVWTEEQN